MILLSAHYDSYFDGFQDDNAAVAMMLGIARSLVKAAISLPTLSFLRNGCRGMGIIDSKYDWSTGAYNQVFRVHPDWQGKVIADLNLNFLHTHTIDRMPSAVPMNMQIHQTVYRQPDCPEGSIS